MNSLGLNMVLTLMESYSMSTAITLSSPSFIDVVFYLDAIKI